MTRIRLAVCAAVCAVATAGLAGCGGEGGDAGPEKTQAVPSDLPSKLPSGTPSGVGTPKPGKLPAGFPLPEGAKKGDFTDNGSSVAGTVTVSDGSKAYDFWVAELPKEGYKVTSSNKAEFEGVKALITFDGKGYSSATITINDKSATISLQK